MRGEGMPGGEGGNGGFRAPTFGSPGTGLVRIPVLLAPFGELDLPPLPLEHIRLGVLGQLKGRGSFQRKAQTSFKYSRLGLDGFK